MFEIIGFLNGRKLLENFIIKNYSQSVLLSYLGSRLFQKKFFGFRKIDSVIR